MTKFEKKSITKKFPLVVIIALCISIGIVFNMVKTMTVDRAKWQETRTKNFEETKDTLRRAHRGNILSTDGQLLASSLPSYNVYIDFLSGISRDGIDSLRAGHPLSRKDSLFYAIKDSVFHASLDSICSGLYEICSDKTKAEYREYLEKNWQKRSRYCELCRHYPLSYTQFKKLQSLPFFSFRGQGPYFAGLNPQERNSRTKPFGSLAKRTIGELYAIDQAEGKSVAKCGLEHAFDSLLRGVDGRIHKRKVRQRMLEVVDREPEDGYDLVTTIDVNMQDVCESALRQQLIDVDAAFGTVILMDVKTGDVKAIVNLVKVGDGIYAEAQNYALTALMEPGSTFKTASMMVALDDGKVGFDETVDTGRGIYNMHGRDMKDSNYACGGHHVIDMQHTLVYSSNIGVSRFIDSRYGQHPEEFVEGLHRVGMGIDLELPFEGVAKPRIRMPNDTRNYWSKTTLAWMSIGYETQIPPISTVTFYNGIANGGRMVAPRFVKAIQKNGEVVEEYPVKVLRERMCKPEVIEHLKDALRKVVNEKGATGTRVASKRFVICGKTGTAQVAKEGVGYHGPGGLEHLLSFCGFFPYEDPQYTCIVAIRKGNGGGGGTTAGPVFKTIAEKVYNKSLISNLDSMFDTLSVFVPEVKHGNIDAARKVLDGLGVKSNQSSGWGHAYIDGKSVKFSGAEFGADVMPDLTGMGARDAVYAVESRGMKLRLVGAGKVYKQSFPPGAKIRKGATVMASMQD